MELDGFSVVLAKYLEVLRVQSLKVLEDRTVNELLGAWQDSSNCKATLPVRLSKFVDRFLICPRPVVVQGPQDGDIRFDDGIGQFLIRLYSTNPHMPLNTLALQHPRTRFTYAHEVAHRFCYVLRDGKWKRAQEVATTGLSHATGLKHRITLSRREEGFCNNVARRVLVPCQFIESNCAVEEWFTRGPGFFKALSDSARQFGVSRHCLLVRLQREVKPETPYFVMLVGPWVGPVTQRGRRVLRVLCGIMPSIRQHHNGEWYPGLELSKLGESAVRMISGLLADRKEKEGTIITELRLGSEHTIRIEGWFRLLRGDADGDDDRVILWGTARQMMG